MIGAWGDVAARARGLSTRLAGEDALAEVETARDRGALVAALGRAGYSSASLGGGGPGAIEAAVRARAAEELAIVARWAALSEDRTRALAVILADEDRRTLRALLRGAAAGASLEARLAAALPTPALPAALLARLAGAASPAVFTTELARARHPFATALRDVLVAPLDLFVAELALARAFAALARAGAPRGPLAAHVAQVIDVENAAAALLLAARGDVEPSRAFVDGGARLDRARFLTTATSRPEPARAALARVFAGTPLAAALTAPDAGAVERAALRWHLTTQDRLRRADPAGVATVLHTILRRRLEGVRIRGAAWRVALGGEP